MPLPRLSTNPAYAGWTELDAMLGVHEQLVKLNARSMGVDHEMIDGDGADITATAGMGNTIANQIKANRLASK